MDTLTFKKTYFQFMGALWIAILLALTGCGSPDNEPQGSGNIDLLEIQRRGTLTAICRYNATGYFIYKGRPMGYEYELLGKLADELKVELKIIIPRTWDEAYTMLKSGQGDIIAANMLITKEHSDRVMFTKAHSTTRQMLVQRKPPGWRNLPQHTIDKKLVRNPLELIDKTVHVRQNSPYHYRLQNLSREIGGDIHFQFSPDGMETEFLIKMVAEGLIPYTVANENLVRSFSYYYTQIDARTPISFPQRIAWGVRKSSPRLKDYIDKWIARMKKSKDPNYHGIYIKYHKNKDHLVKRLGSPYYSFTGGHISPYDSLFIKYSKILEWDWKLVASTAFQESQFNPGAKSWVGATGIMQLLPSTAEELGVTDLEDPEQNIRAGIQFIKLLYNFWEEIPTKEDRIKFTLASYNAGQGHIMDARRLAEKHGKDPYIWTGSVDEFILKKSEERYFYDEVVKHGYCRGEEPYNFVKEVMERYEIYKRYGEYAGLETSMYELEGLPVSSTESESQAPQ